MEIYNNQFKYLELRDGSVIIIKYIGADNNVTVPAEINGKPVTEIDDDAFAGRDNLKICISSEVRFGKVSFAPNAKSAPAVSTKPRTENLPSFEINDFGDYIIINDHYSATIYKYNGTATNVIIPSKINGLKVDTIGSYAFSSSEVKSITIPDSAYKIGEYAFSNRESLLSIDIPSSVEKNRQGRF